MEIDFLGTKLQYVTHNYFKYNAIIDNDNILIRTNDIKSSRNGDYILVINGNKGVYIPSWACRTIYNRKGDCGGIFEEGIYLVKVSRQYFKPYTFKFIFDGYSLKEQDTTFDELYQIAVEQQKFDEEHELTFC